jgi:ADP-heptose:LPS heptosyltransferase
VPDDLLRAPREAPAARLAVVYEPPLARPARPARVEPAAAPQVAPVLRVPSAQVRRVVVFRALMLGDMLCAVPALRALRSAYPAASITLVGLPWCEGLARRLPYVDEFIAFPGFPGLPEVQPEIGALPGFLAKLQARHFDLALQLHGNGRLVNSLVAAFGARHTAAFAEDDDFSPEPGLDCRFPRQGHEIERLLALTDTLGIERRGLELEFPLVRRDEQTVEDMVDPVTWRRFVCIHPGSQLPSRRWPIERFREVADALVHDGWSLVVTGSAGEAPLARELARGRPRIIDLSGRSTLWQLGALVRQARLVISNDTGISHIAAAVGTRSVVVSSGADVARWAPLRHDLHEVLWGDVPCRPCGHRECPTGHECAQAVSSAQVLAAARRALRAADAG